MKLFNERYKATFTAHRVKRMPAMQRGFWDTTLKLIDGKEVTVYFNRSFGYSSYFKWDDSVYHVSDANFDNAIELAPVNKTTKKVGAHDTNEST